jgi:hypothetical protein
MNKITEEFAVKKYLELKSKLGKQPSYVDFKNNAKTTGISRRALERLFGSNSWSKLVQVAGDQTDTFIKPGKSSEDYFNVYAKAVQKTKGHPTEVTWNFNGYKPIVDSYRKKFNQPWSKIPDLFRQYAKGKSEYQEALSYLQPELLIHQAETIETLIPASDKNRFIPPTLVELSDFKGNEKDFEIKIQDALQILGFKVTRLGLPNEPDGIAGRPINSYAILFDAKSHLEAYSITAGDRRAAVNYIKNWKTKLVKKGYSDLFFAFVARTFITDSLKNIDEIRKETNITTILLTTSSLVDLAVAHIQNSHDFDHDKLKSVFSKGGLIGPKEIKPLLDTQSNEKNML